MLKSLKTIGGATLLLSFAAACTTVNRDVQTPTGPQPQVDGELHVLRLVRKATTTGNQRRARDGVIEENIAMKCPANTQAVVPVIEQQAYGYGEITPDDLSSVDPATGVITIDWTRVRDHHIGMVVSGISVSDIDAVGPDGEQNVTLVARAFLTDEGGDDRWWWVASYNVLCLGDPA